MTHIRRLSASEQHRFQKWLQDLDITLNDRTRRDVYCNVPPVARIFKRSHKRVDLNCYPTVSSVALRLKNWRVFNFRVLRKLGLCRAPWELQNLAAGKEGAVDCLLYELMERVSRV